MANQTISRKFVGGKKRENKHVRQVEPDTRHPLGDSSEDEYAWTMHNRPTNKTTARKSPMTVIAVNNINAKMMIDTGASVNMMDERTYEMIRKPALMKHRGPRIMPYGGGTPLNVLGGGGGDVSLELKSAIQCHRFHVIKGAHGSLVGFNTARGHCQQTRLQL